ncbi:MAG: CDP-diacylglycerol--glycerol-3-phosphate 3-phosphatidyltransferase [Holosporales bacterium]|jgi:cardiolipin synthase|nr:CDP-diacylglycerol--glycerol-3-phosphate 3-phosphatidyltransferase [Holosporales bacterium]
MYFSIPNLLTLGRIGVIPIILGLFYLEKPWVTSLQVTLFILACLTDYLDGYVARTYHQTSPLGRILDPLADKLLTTLTFFMLAGFGWIERDLLLLPALIIAREIAIPGLREILEECPEKILHVSQLAKWKTALQMVVIASLLFNSREGRFEWLTVLNYYGLWLASFITVLSGYLYWKNSPSLNRNEEEA